MPKNFPTKCRICGVKRSDEVYVSRRGKCTSCATALVEAAVRGAYDQAAAVKEQLRSARAPE